MDTFREAKKAVVGAAQSIKEKAMEATEKVVDKIKGQPAEGEPVDALTLLKTDHQKVSGFFAQLEATGEGTPQLREGLFSQLKYELDTHAEVEEELFYPTIAKKGTEAAELIKHALAEHEQVKKLLVELSEGQMAGADWMAKLRVLKENVEHHVQMEEEKIFKIARSELDERELDFLGSQLERAKLELDDNAKSRRRPSA